MLTTKPAHCQDERGYGAINNFLNMPIRLGEPLFSFLEEKDKRLPARMNYLTQEE